MQVKAEPAVSSAAMSAVLVGDLTPCRSRRRSGAWRRKITVSAAGRTSTDVELGAAMVKVGQFALVPGATCREKAGKNAVKSGEETTPKAGGNARSQT